MDIMLNEKMGIPDGIEKQGRMVYDKLIDKLNSIDVNKLINDLSEMSHGDVIEIDLMYIDLEISDVKKNKIPFILEFTKHDSVKKISIMSASNQVGNKIDSINGELKLINKESRFGIELAFNDELIESGNIISDIIDEIKGFIKPHIISHEIKHFYDNEKKKENNLLKSSEYISYQINGFPKILSEFTYLLYYMTMSENLVRPSELYHMLSDNGVTKNNFKEFVSETEIMKNIDKSINFNLSEFIIKLNNNEDVKIIINSGEKRGYTRIGNYGEDMLNILFINISSKAIDYTKGIIDRYISYSENNTLSSLMAFFNREEKELDYDVINNSYKKVVKKYSKYSKNPIKYFEYLEKKLNFIGNKMKKKLYKLYDMVEDKNKGDNTIFNWDLHNKINSKNEKILLKFKDFNNIKFDKGYKK